MSILDPKHNFFPRTVVFDPETTGLSPKHGDRVIEIGAISIEGGKIREEFHSLISVDQPIHPLAQRVHGITKEMLDGQPNPSEILPRFHGFITGSILVAHNASYDVRFIANELAMLGLGLNNVCYCTLALGRRMCPGLVRHDLETLYRHFYKRSPKRLHRALPDARLTAEVWIKMTQQSVTLTLLDAFLPQLSRG